MKRVMLSSRSGDVLIQISESQRRLTLELEGLVSDIITTLKTAFAYESVVLCLTWMLCVSLQCRWFSMEVLQEMDNNIRLDKDYISVSDTQKQGRDEVKRGLLQNDKLLSRNYVQGRKINNCGAS